MSRALYRGLSRRLADAWAACGYQEMKASVADPFSETCVSNCIHSAAGHTHYTQHYTLCACVLGGKGGMVSVNLTQKPLVSLHCH